MTAAFNGVAEVRRANAASQSNTVMVVFMALLRWLLVASSSDDRGTLLLFMSFGQVLVARVFFRWTVALISKGATIELPGIVSEA